MLKYHWQTSYRSRYLEDPLQTTHLSGYQQNSDACIGGDRLEVLNMRIIEVIGSMSMTKTEKRPSFGKV